MCADRRYLIPTACDLFDNPLVRWRVGAEPDTERVGVHRKISVWKPQRSCNRQLELGAPSGKQLPLGHRLSTQHRPPTTTTLEDTPLMVLMASERTSVGQFNNHVRSGLLGHREYRRGMPVRPENTISRAQSPVGNPPTKSWDRRTVRHLLSMARRHQQHEPRGLLRSHIGRELLQAGADVCVHPPRFVAPMRQGHKMKQSAPRQDAPGEDLLRFTQRFLGHQRPSRSFGAWWRPLRTQRRSRQGLPAPTAAALRRGGPPNGPKCAVQRPKS